MTTNFDDTLINQLLDLSRTYLKLAKASRGSYAKWTSIEEYAFVKKNYSDAFRRTFDNKIEDLFLTENGCVLTIFALLYDQEFLTKDDREKIIKNLDQYKGKYPIIAQLSQEITFIREEYDGFSTINEKRLVLMIPRTTNVLADVIISTEISRLITIQNPAYNTREYNETFHICSNASGFGFEVIFTKPEVHDSES